MSIRLNVMNRAQGKTYEIIKRIENDTYHEMIVLVTSNSAKELYPSHVSHKVFVVNNINSLDFLRGLKFKKALIDEGFSYSKDKMALLYYELGLRGWDIEVYGTPDLN